MPENMGIYADYIFLLVPQNMMFLHFCENCFKIENMLRKIGDLVVASNE